MHIVLFVLFRPSTTVHHRLMSSKRPLVRSKQDITYGDGIAYQLVQLPSHALISLSQNVTLVPSPSTTIEGLLYKSGLDKRLHFKSAIARSSLSLM